MTLVHSSEHPSRTAAVMAVLPLLEALADEHGEITIEVHELGGGLVRVVVEAIDAAARAFGRRSGSRAA